MKFLIDESISSAVAEGLRASGHDVSSIVEAGLAGVKDEDVFALARSERAVLVTRDHGFTRQTRFPSNEVGAILYVRPGNLTAEEEARLVVSFVQAHEFDLFQGALVTITRSGVRIRGSP